MEIKKYMLKNIQLLVQKYPFLGSVFNSHDKTADIEFIPARTGALTARWKDILLHSQFDPRKEATRFLQGSKVAQGDNVLLYGWGLGYHVEQLADKIGRNGRLVVVELNPQIVSAAMKVMDIVSFWDKCNLDLVYGESEQSIAEEIKKLNIDGGGWKILIHQASYKCMDSKFKNITSLFEMNMMENRTGDVFRKKFCDNLNKNLDVFIRSPGINDYKDFFKGQSVLLVGAGPSLDDNLNYLRKNQDKHYIVCVDTSFPILIENDITPDFVVSVDPQPETMRHFRCFAKKRVPLIVTPVSCAELVEKYPGPILFFLQKDHSVTKSLEKYFADKGVSYSGGSVSCFALDIAVQFGFERIILVGMDYAYTNMRVYSANAQESILLFRSSNRFCSIETLHRKKIYSDKLLRVSSYENETVYSNISLCSYKKNIENLVAIYRPEVTFYNLVSGGALVKGAEKVTRDGVSALACSEPKKEIRISEVQCEPGLKDKVLSVLNSS